MDLSLPDQPVIDLNQMLRTERRKLFTPKVEKRAHERYTLDHASSQFVYRGSKYPCQLVDVSMGGCCVRIERRFNAGALAPVEVLFPVFGLQITQVGVTVWFDEIDNLIGVRFIHASPKSRNQLAGLITCLIDRDAALAILEANKAKAALPESAPAVSELQPEVAAVAEVASEPSVCVHGDATSVKAPSVNAWRAILRLPSQRMQFIGAIEELSTAGCRFKADLKLPALLHAIVEVEFEQRGLHIRLAGTVPELYGDQTLGVRFGTLNARRKEDLRQLVEELLAYGSRQDDQRIERMLSSVMTVSPIEAAAQEQPEIDDWVEPKIFFREPL